MNGSEFGAVHSGGKLLLLLVVYRLRQFYKRVVTQYRFGGSCLEDHELNILL